jgi:hypothetical protein
MRHAHAGLAIPDFPMAHESYNKKKMLTRPPVWFALSEERPLAFFAGI